MLTIHELAAALASGGSLGNLIEQVNLPAVHDTSNLELRGPQSLTLREKNVGPKQHLVRQMVGLTNGHFSHDDARMALNAASYAMAHALIHGDYVTLPYIGRFELQKRRGQPYQYAQNAHGVGYASHPTRHLPKFTAAPWLRNEIHKHMDNFEYRGGKLPYRSRRGQGS